MTDREKLDYSVTIDAAHPDTGERTVEAELVEAYDEADAIRRAREKVWDDGFEDPIAIKVERYTPWGKTCGDAATATGMYDHW